MGVGLKSCARAGGGAKTFLGELGGGAETLDERAGGGARKFCLSLKWVHIVGSDFRGWREGGGGAKKVVGGRGRDQGAGWECWGWSRKVLPEPRARSQRRRGSWSRSQNLGWGGWGRGHSLTRRGGAGKQGA